MSCKIFLFAVFIIGTTTSVNGCCRNCNILQFRRPNILPVFESPPLPPPPPPSSPYEVIYPEPEPFCDGPLENVYDNEAVGKFEGPINRFIPSFMEQPKIIGHKCPCNKPPLPPPRLIPRYFKRRICNEQMVEALGMRQPPPPPPPPPQHFGQCNSCNQYDDCGQYGSCGMPPVVFRPPPPPPPQMMPLTLPASCIC